VECPHARALLLGTVFGYGAVIMSYVSPDTVFAFLVNSYGTVAIVVSMAFIPDQRTPLIFGMISLGALAASFAVTRRPSV
jgi:L-asparagine transporter-like permease